MLNHLGLIRMVFLNEFLNLGVPNNFALLEAIVETVLGDIYTYVLPFL